MLTKNLVRGDPRVTHLNISTEIWRLDEPESVLNTVLAEVKRCDESLLM